mgnify:CR=1 FL=1
MRCFSLLILLLAFCLTACWRIEPVLDFSALRVRETQIAPLPHGYPAPVLSGYP